ncbi:hypothetical protein SEA_DAUBENSKI_189 [Streptomyces phage Daubenski]|uniref:C2H2-type domain-containing protein n=1 Tax=Streptomyces phage Daubenski TaxID=2653725 RepID=A0A5Q2WDF5_9CAUD|nr:hypothetical protein KNU80_gp111 [Streptomyces phage Daubenski]QGH76461.1 hypothetical protein SEA_DAUBENSKI_189 [Streptomyces phage Daubenski]
MDNLSGRKISLMMSLIENPKSQVSANPVKIGCTQTTPKMGEEAFRCSDCGYQFPNHADTCQYHPDNMK